MSTKTTIKRIALVAVAALGMGVLSTVPASAARTLDGISNLNNITASTNRTPVAGINGLSAVTSFTFTSDSTTAAPTISPVVKLTSKPTGSVMSDTVTAYATTLSTTGTWNMQTGTVTQTVADAIAWTTAGGAAFNTQGGDLALSTVNQAGYYTGTLRVHARYDLAGSYTWTVFDDTNNDKIVNGGDFARSFTVVVSGSSNTTSAVGTMTAISSSSAVAGTNGALIKITLKDAAGNPVAPDQTAGVKLTVSGSGKVHAVNGDDVTDASTYSLGAGNFNGSGIAFVNITNAVAETVTVNLENNGLSAFTAPAAVALTFRTITATATGVTALLDATIPASTSATAYTYDGAARSVSFKTNTAAATYDKVTVTDASGAITGRAGAVYDIAVVGATTGDDKGSFSLTFASATTASTTFVVNAGSTNTLAYAAAAVDSLAVSVGSSQRALTASAVSFTVRAKDQYGSALANKTVTATISGRNSGVTVASAITNATGFATLTYTDASTSTSSMTDTVTFTQGAKTATASITWTSAANLGVATIALVTPSETVAGTVNSPAVNSAINAGDGVEVGAVSVTATVTDANKVVVAGVPVTFTVSGTTAAITSTTKTVVTGSDGKATAKLYAWATGSYTVTATYGTVSDTATSTWTQENGDYARTLTVAASGNSAIATVKDRLGNPIKGVELTATRVGTGTFGGVTSVKGTTLANGTVEFVLTGGTADVTVAFSTATFGQSDALKGLIDGTTATSTFTATTAGTTILNEEGVGAAFDAAGNNSATVNVTGDTTSADTAQAAADAAAEATDAANAATDAANAAAEAADAATAAAQDAADAVAALSTQVSEMVNALKKQITALTNLVIKIQKKVRA
jgi:trimeric autotransporter adhesin